MEEREYREQIQFIRDRASALLNKLMQRTGIDTEILRDAVLDILQNDIPQLESMAEQKPRILQGIIKNIQALEDLSND
ncbi:MAG: hypothetical protein WBA77_00345 [Microcoleaceae cyanobacterium]